MTTISALPPAPSRADPSTFSDKADAFVAALPTFGTQCNAVASEVYTNSVNASNSAAIAIASANFKGAWSSLTGALAVPASVLHSSKLWLLVANIADVTAHTPGVSASWVDLDNLTSASRLSTARTIAVSGKATGTATSFDGTANITIPITATDSIGEGQTWQNLTASRSLATDYTNSTGRSICLMITFMQAATHRSYGYVYAGGMIDPIYTGSFGDLDGAVDGLHVASVIVPPGAQYKATVSDVHTRVYRWYELR